MKYYLLFFSSLIALSVSSQSAWKSPNYKAETYRKVLVLAKITDQLAKREIEDETVKLLEQKEIKAIPAYSNITEADMATEEAFLKKADELMLDGLIVYTPSSSGTKYKNTPSANVHMGVPIKLGIFRGSIGGNVPLAGGTKQVTIVNANAAFYNRTSNDMQWSYALSGKLNSGTSKLAASFAKSTINRMFKDDLFTQ
jgi:hypothetical protein